MDRFYFKRRARFRFDTEGIPIKKKKVLFGCGEAAEEDFLAISKRWVY
jgi:hypothetical protein